MVSLLVQFLAVLSWGVLGVFADRQLNLINACPQAITIFVSGESQGSIASGATVTKSVPDDWSGFIYSNVNAPEGNTGAGTTKAGFVAEVRSSHLYASFQVADIWFVSSFDVGSVLLHCEGLI
jgi:hypothetical protein